jgi:hypothetical protein
LPHEPQLKLSLVTSTQTPLQTVGALAGQLHTLEVHTPPSAHALPQLPQFCGSVVMLEHPVGHVIVPDGHVQTPLLHCAPALQAVPQLAQFAGSVWVSVQTEPH